MENIINELDKFIWGPPLLISLVGTAIYLTIKMRFLPWRNLKYSLSLVFGKESFKTDQKNGDVSPFSSLMTALAATIGTGNIVGVATALFAGGPGALVWMIISAAFGLSTKFAECALSVKYREKNQDGLMAGGPMYTMKNGFSNKRFGLILGTIFAICTIFASFGVGNLTQANSISSALESTFQFNPIIIGIVLAIIIFFVIIGGIKSIAKVTTAIVPFMAIIYIVFGFIVIFSNYQNLPLAISQIFIMAFNPQAINGGIIGTITVTVMNSMRLGIARGVFSNEAGLGSAAISASSASTDNHVKQGYINMTGTFIDTFIVCSITALAITSSGVLGSVVNGLPLNGIDLTIAAYSSVLGNFGQYFITFSICLFAFSTIIGWQYNGEKAFEFIFKTAKYNKYYRVFYAIIVYFGCITSIGIVWGISDIFNGLMAIPNLICVLVLSKEISQDIIQYQNLNK